MSSSSDDDDADSFSSDDEYLTSSKGSGQGKGSVQDREALIRKKLLESFYGGGVATASATEPVVPPITPSSQSSVIKTDLLPPSGKKVSASEGAADVKNDRKGARLNRNTSKDKKDVSSDLSKPPPHLSKIILPASAEYDLDSHKFDPNLYAKAQFENCSTAQLLETQEHLSLDVRRLDSTMQTLVYENYSKFIEATDAVRSISRLSSASTEEKLARLALGTDRIDRIVRTMDEALRSSREAVAEKLRVKRLLTRLDALLKLPVTLRDYISTERYQEGAKSYLDAIAILGQHSAGFESLKSIEVECQSIVRQMLVNLRNSIFIWSGATARWKRITMNLSEICSLNFQVNTRSGIHSDNEDDDDDDDDDDEKDDEDNETKFNTEDENKDDAAFHTSRVVGYPSVILSPREAPQSMREIFECVGTLLMFAAEKTSNSKVTLNLTENDCKILALESCNKYLQKILDEHVVNWNQVKSSMDEKDVEKNVTLELAPTHFLQHLLESIRLYVGIFRKDKKLLEEHDSRAINDFVLKMFGVFLGHIRHGALDWNSSSDNALEMDVEEIFQFISQALSKILRSVRDFTSALAQPDIGVNFDDVSGSLIDRTTSVMETVAERQISLEFDSLRMRAIKECLLPFIQESVALNCGPESEKSGLASERISKTMQMGKSSISECMHHLEDSITRTLPKSTKPGILTVDSDFVKDTVRKNARGFALWLAHCLESLSGIRDPTSSQVLILLKDDENGEESATVLSQDTDWKDGLDITSDKADDEVLEDMCSYFHHFAPNDSNSAILLTMVEMCRLGSSQIGSDLNESLTEEDSKAGSIRSDGIFSIPAKAQLLNIDSDDLLSRRFDLAASRVFFYYYSSKGAEAASYGCHDLVHVSVDPVSDIPVGPSDWACRFLEVVKFVFISGASTFGGGKVGGPVPRFSDEDMKNMSQLAQIQSHHLAAIKSLRLDIFKNKVKIYPHPLQIVEFSRNFAVCNVFKIGLKALCEQSRTCTFTVSSYRQMQVDVEFLRRMTSHYIKEESGVDTTEINQLLDDLVNTAGYRCVDSDCIDVTLYKDTRTGEKHTPTSICAAFLVKSRTLNSFIISKDSK